MTDFEGILRVLAAAAVRYVLVGGMAATVHGSVRLTLDVDIVYDRAGENLERLVIALAPYGPYPRGAPPGLPFQWDSLTLRRGLNFTLETSLGDIDLLGEIVGGGSYQDLLPSARSVVVLGYDVQCLNLDKLIQVKRAAGRPKDFEAVAELEALWEEQRSPGA